MKEDRRSGADKRQRFDHPPPMVTARLAFATNSAPDEFFQNASQAGADALYHYTSSAFCFALHFLIPNARCPH